MRPCSSIVGYPAFAVDDPALAAAHPRAVIVDKLQGRYGCKRFLRDGHQTVLEDHARLHYEPGELGNFEHIESEWPLFFTYLLLDAALLRGDAAEGGDRLSAHRLDALMQERDGQRCCPSCTSCPPTRWTPNVRVPHSQDARAERQRAAGVGPEPVRRRRAAAGRACQRRSDRPAGPPPRGRGCVSIVQVALLAEDELVASGWQRAVWRHSRGVVAAMAGA